jgi:hypothetical protein
MEQIDPPSQLKYIWLFRTSRTTNRGLPHQEDLEEFFPFFDQIAHEALSAHGVLTR